MDYARTCYLHNHKHYQQQGFNLVEAAIVLGVVGLVIGGIWVAASAVTENRKQARMSEQVLLVVQNIRQIYGGRPPVAETYFTSLHNAASWASVFPADAISATSPVSPWGTELGAIYRDMTSQIEVDIYGLSTASCAALAPRIFAAIRSQNGSIISMNNGDDLSTPSLAATNCGTEFAANGEAGIIVSVPF